MGAILKIINYYALVFEAINLGGLGASPQTQSGRITLSLRYFYLFFPFKFKESFNLKLSQIH